MMKVTIDTVETKNEGFWTSRIDPQRLLKLSNPVRQGGQINIVLVTCPFHDKQKHNLQFDLDSVVLLNLGNTFETVFIDSREEQRLKGQALTSSGDSLFLKELGRLEPEKIAIGKRLLTDIRKEFPGELIYHQKSGKFVESPDNFWVIRIQPRVQTLRITVYGKPYEYGETETINLKPDMGSYSSFILKNGNQIDEALEVIRKAKQLKDGRSFGKSK
jgi:hypothetical protein